MPVRVGLYGLALLTLGMFFEPLVMPGAQVLGTPQGDLAYQFLPWRDFGFSELAKGDFPLWNPHIFAGAPFFGGMQSALLYPPNWLFLVLPLAVATNWSIALNVWLLGTFTHLWALRRGLHPFAAFVAAALLMFGAPHFLHVYAGHLTSLATMAWVPLLFLAIDEWLATRRPAWCLVGMLAVAMQILAGHPQYVYFTALVAGGYSLLRLAEPQRGRLAAAAGLLSLHAGGALLAAVQLMAGVQATTETIRDAAVPFEFAASFSFPPENLVTLLAPAFFGDHSMHPYWGRWYLWEACAFIGVTGLALAAYGMVAARTAGKKVLLVMVAATVLLALGDHTPLFRLLYDWLPLFDKFRGAGKFLFLTALFLVLFAACGLDRILRERAVPKRAIGIAGAAVVALFAGALAVRMLDWGAVAKALLATGQTYTHPGRYSDAELVSASQNFASLGLVVAGLTLALAAVLAVWTRREHRAIFLLGALAVAEIFAFARLHRPTFDSRQIVIPELQHFLASNPGDFRILNLRFSNSAISMRAFDAWGYDPGVTRRYAEFVTWSEGGDPGTATQYVPFRHFHPLLSMLRVRYLVVIEGEVMRIIPSGAAPLPRLQLVGSYQVHPEPAAVLRAMGEPTFDPRKEVILERPPHPVPAIGYGEGRARVIREGSDFIEIIADVAQPSMLLVTDAWASGWRATALEGSSQHSYEVMPANYALRAVALGAGKHRLRLEYAPPAIRIGAIASAVAWLSWIAAALLMWRRRRVAK